MALLSAFTLGACTQNQNNEASEETTVPTEVIETNEDIIDISYTNENDEKMDVTFNNILNTATVVFGGDTIELKEQKSASGIWYENEQYELRGKAEKVKLLKDDKVVFEN